MINELDSFGWQTDPPEKPGKYEVRYTLDGEDFQGEAMYDPLITHSWWHRFGADAKVAAWREAKAGDPVFD